MSFGNAVVYSLLGMLVVFFALVLIMLMIQIMTAVGKRRERAPAAPAPIQAARVQAAPAAPAPGSAGDVKLYDTDPRIAAMLMAIVADELKAPLNELRFISIREIKENEHEI